MQIRAKVVEPDSREVIRLLHLEVLCLGGYGRDPLERGHCEVLKT